MQIANHGSVFLLTPESDAELSWVWEHVAVPDWAWLGVSFSCDPRCLRDLIAALESEVTS